MTVRVTFLGGLGEIGRNCATLEIDGRLALIDCGLMFPEEDMLGVDLVLPDFTSVLERADDLLLARVGEGVALAWRDPDPLADAQRVGFRRDGATVDAADVDVLSPEVRTHIFKAAPTQWQYLSGAWEVSNRWSCSPNWTWLAD